MGRNFAIAYLGKHLKILARRWHSSFTEIETLDLSHLVFVFFSRPPPPVLGPKPKLQRPPPPGATSPGPPLPKRPPPLVAKSGTKPVAEDGEKEDTQSSAGKLAENCREKKTLFLL